MTFDAIAHALAGQKLDAELVKRFTTERTVADLKDDLRESRTALAECAGVERAASHRTSAGCVKARELGEELVDRDDLGRVTSAELKHGRMRQSRRKAIDDPVQKVGGARALDEQDPTLEVT